MLGVTVGIGVLKGEDGLVDGPAVSAAQQADQFQNKRLTMPRLAGQMASRAALSLAFLAGFVWLLSDRWAQIDTVALAQAFAGLRADQWGLALGLTSLSFWAVGRYDAVLHRHFATGLPGRLTRRAGICAIAVSQTLGLGLISGAILRWRMLPGFSLWQATQLTAAVALSFLAGWAVVTSVTLVILPHAPFRGWAMLVLVAATALVALSIYAPRLPGLRFRWPNAFTLSRLILLCAVDTLAAALAFHALLPAGSALPFASLLPAFLLALGAGLALGTPGGIGAFEVTLIALLPNGENAEVMATILAWRLVYYALPALLGAALAIVGPASKDFGRAEPKPLQPVLMPRTNPAEAGLRHQGTLSLPLIAGQPWLVGRRSHALIALADPVGPRRSQSIDLALLAHQNLARHESRLPVVYKSSARLAARARRQGQKLRRIGWEAWLNPSEYRLAASCRSGLRRKLRRAESAAVQVTHSRADQAPWRALDQIAAQWASAHGGERGFSMGQYQRDYVAQQRLYIAWQDGQPIAFASFHTTPTEWALDLMRHGPKVPDGTMHSLIQAAIKDAAESGLTRLSLAAVPETCLNQNGLINRLLTAVVPEMANTGLYQFKSAFAPHWRPLYLAAPGHFGLLIAAMSLWRAITRPAPIMRQIERDDEEYGFATDATAWQMVHERS